MTSIIPIPRSEIDIRVATLDDLSFLDSLQKQYNKALGFFPRAQMEGYVRNQWVLIAQESASGRRLGYCASRDRYLKRDELGVIYQLCVDPAAQRSLVGAALVRAVLDRSAYGCRLYCCWCAQDLEANHFWESLGFVPIAFRGGSTGKRRVHIFWQRRVREGDTTTPWWFPAKTDSGAMREDRLVFPIPPGLSWRDEMPVLRAQAPENAALPEKIERSIKTRNNLVPGTKCGPQTPTPPPRARVQFGPPGATPVVVENEKPAAKKPAKKPPAAPIDPKFVSAARELRDRYLEQVNADTGAPGLPQGKYDVARQLAPAPHVKRLRAA